MFKKIFSPCFAVFVLMLCASFSAQAAVSMNALLRQPGDPISGNPNGKITMVEFSDYQCSHCVSMYPVVKSLINKNKDLRVVYKLLPIRGNVSLIATQAAISAQKQGKFNKFNNALVNSASSLDEKLIYSLAKSSGLNIDQLKKDMKSKAVNQIIEKNMQLARDVGLRGTPTFYFAKTNSQDFSSITTVLGSVNERALQNAVNAAGH